MLEKYKTIAKEIIERFHDKAAADKAEQEFIHRFQKGAMPDEVPEFTLVASAGNLPIANVLKETGLVPSTSNAYQMVKQGAVKLDGKKLTDKSLRLSVGDEVVCQVGKRRFARVKIAE